MSQALEELNKNYDLKSQEVENKTKENETIVDELNTKLVRGHQNRNHSMHQYICFSLIFPKNINVTVLFQKDKFDNMQA